MEEKKRASHAQARPPQSSSGRYSAGTSPSPRGWGRSGRLVYVNCGHNPHLLLRQDGSVKRLAPTALVIGLFEQWECSVEQIRLAPGDLLVIFSDGATEEVRNEEEYREARLIRELQACRYLPVNEGSLSQRRILKVDTAD